MDTKKHKVKVGNHNIRIYRRDWERRAQDLGMCVDNLEQYTDTELVRLVVMKQLSKGETEKKKKTLKEIYTASKDNRLN